MSPAGGMSAMMHRSTSDFATYAAMGGMVPPHLRPEMQQPSPRSSPALNSQPYPPTMHQPQPRAPVTSHPTGYGPPQVLEPPTTTNGQTGSANGSPHMSAIGWQSPSQQGLPSPGPADSYVYPDQTNNYGAPPQSMYYQSNMPRPGSAEPNEHYNARQWGQMSASSVPNL